MKLIHKSVRDSQSKLSTSLKTFVNEGKSVDTAPKEQFSLDVDKERIRDTLARSFAGTEEVSGEPFLEWAIHHYEFPTIKERVQFFRFIIAFDLWEDFRHNSFQLALEEADGSIASAISVRDFDPAKEAAKEGSTIRKIQKKWRFFATVVKQLKDLPRMMRDPAFKQEEVLFSKKTDKWFEEATSFKLKYGPSEKFWYVHLVGCHPDFKGQGKGKAMMNKLCEFADQMDKDMFLEAGESNQPFYAKFGFETQHVEPFSDPTDPDAEPFKMHLMVRKSLADKK